MGIRPMVHLVHRSKTGLIAPPWSELKEALQGLRNQVDIIVDACQARIDPSLLNEYLAEGAMVLWTGSKFIGGAPFSGALMVPPALSERARNKTSLPKGLGDFFTRSEWPDEWKGADNILPFKENFGLLLRCESALFELERLISMPETLSETVINSFYDSVLTMARDSEIFELLAPHPMGREISACTNHPFEKEMIFTLAINASHPQTGEPLTHEDARDLYRYLFSDLSFKRTGEEYVLSSIIHVGQPVKGFPLGGGKWRATLRLALGAPMINSIAMLHRERIRERFRLDMELFLEKTKLAINILGER